MLQSVEHGVAGRARRALRRLGASAAPWLALALLWALFDLPLIVSEQALPATGELLLLATLFVGLQRLGVPRLRRALLALLALAAAFLIVVRLDRVIFRWLMNEEPLLYDQLFLLRHLFVLSGDLFGPELLLGVGALALSIWALRWLVRRLLRSIAGLAAPGRFRQAVIGFGLLWSIVLVAGLLPGRSRAAVYWMTPRLLENLAQSGRVYRTVQRRVRRSPYAAYDSLRLTRRPHIWLVFVESYGRFMLDEPLLRPRWEQKMERMQQRLQRAGWSSASALSQASISGGRSWLAEASVLTGTLVRYEAVFHHMTRDMQRLPNLVRFLSRQGYQTVVLAPADRVRPGVEVADHYGYDRYVRFDDLEYRGRHIGWGLVPDQYSLGHTQQHVLSAIDGPSFFNFHMVSSHAPFRDVPQLARDWRTLANGRADAAPAREGEWLVRMRRYARRGRRHSWMGRPSAAQVYDYQRAVFYSLSVIEQALREQEGDRLVILMGDHQPPLLARNNRSFDVPVHILARDRELLREFEDQGFTSGMRPVAGDKAQLAHQGLFSLVVRSLARCCADTETLPQYFPEGPP